jgi:hypothetical protein
MLCLGRRPLNGHRGAIALARPHHARPSRAAGSFSGQSLPFGGMQPVTGPRPVPLASDTSH